MTIDHFFHICIEKRYIGMVEMKDDDKEDLIFIFRQLFERGKISKEELDKCIGRVLVCSFGRR